MKERENKEERKKCQRIGYSERVWENIEEEEEEESQEWKTGKKEIHDKNERESRIVRGGKYHCLKWQKWIFADSRKHMSPFQFGSSLITKRNC